jgi:hypothetical protein
VAKLAVHPKAKISEGVNRELKDTIYHANAMPTGDNLFQLQRETTCVSSESISVYIFMKKYGAAF